MINSMAQHSHISYLPMSTKGCSGFFLFRLDLELLRKLVSVRVQKPGHFHFLQITQDLNKIKKILNTLFQTFVRRKRVQNFNKVRACQNFQFFRQNTWFLENNRALSKVLYGVLHCLINIMKQYKNQFIKHNFILTTRATLIEVLRIY